MSKPLELLSRWKCVEYRVSLNACTNCLASGFVFYIRTRAPDGVADRLCSACYGEHLKKWRKRQKAQRENASQTCVTALQTYDELSDANKKIVYRQLLKRFRHMDIPLPKAKALIELFFPHIKFTSWRNSNQYVVPTLVIGKIQRFRDSTMTTRSKRK